MSEQPSQPNPLAGLATIGGLLRLALPLAAGAGVTYAMQFVNRLFLSWYSPEALAASLPAGMSAYTIQCFFLSSAGYLGAFAAQHHGAGEADEAGAMAWPMFWLALLAGVLSMALIPFCPALFAGFGATPAVTSDMANLGAWYFVETAPAVLCAGLAGFFGGIGRTGLIAVVSVGACVLSIVLNYWLIFGGLGVPALGINGAGAATLIATVLSAGVWLGLFFAPDMRRLFGTWRQRNCDSARLIRYARHGLARGGTEVIEMAAMLVFTAGITHLGTEALAANNVALSLYLLVFVPIAGFGQGLTIAVGQAIGAGQPDLARRATFRGLAIVLSGVAVWVVLCLWCPRWLVALYIDRDHAADPALWARITAQALPVLTIMAFASIADAIHMVYRFAIQGAGDTRWPLTVLTTCSMVLMGIPVWLMTTQLSPTQWAQFGVQPLTLCWLVMTLYIVVIAVIMALRFHFGPWARMSVRS